MNSKNLVVLVDANDHELGTIDRMKAHQGMGLLHRAISVFLFDQQGRVLMQQRHPEKPLWGEYWSNSCCTHPFPSEDARIAALRRVQEELGLTVDLTFRYKFQYQASFTQDLAEHELVSVYTGVADEDPTVDPSEIVAWQWFDVRQLHQQLKTNREKFTPWAIKEWNELIERGVIQL